MTAIFKAANKMVFNVWGSTHVLLDVFSKRYFIYYLTEEPSNTITASGINDLCGPSDSYFSCRQA
jgi:hypothetical protein